MKNLSKAVTNVQVPMEQRTGVMIMDHGPPLCREQAEFVMPTEELCHWVP